MKKAFNFLGEVWPFITWVVAFVLIFIVLPEDGHDVMLLFTGAFFGLLAGLRYADSRPE